jgi:hypothetical protein
MPYRVFLAFNAAGGLVWGVGFTLLGYYAGDAYKRVEKTAGTAVAIVVAVVVVAALVYWHFRRRRQEAGDEARSEEAEGSEKAEAWTEAERSGALDGDDGARADGRSGADDGPRGDDGAGGAWRDDAGR